MRATFSSSSALPGWCLTSSGRSAISRQMFLIVIWVSVSSRLSSDWCGMFSISCGLRMSEPTTPRPLLNTEEPICAQYDHLACADRTCLPKDHFCDGIPDCYDKSDEGWCGECGYCWLFGSENKNFIWPILETDANHDPNAASSCNLQNCTLPDCFCSRDGTMIPGGLPLNQV